MNAQTKNKHMTQEDRIMIEDSLRLNVNFKQIARNIGKDQTTVSKEIRRNIQVLRPAKNEDAKPCEKLVKAPYVCNGCSKKNFCRLEIHVYNARKAQTTYETTLVESRTGIALNKESFYKADEIVKQGLELGQHIYHIAATHDLKMSIASVYRNINNGYFSSGRMDLPRAVKFKPRKSHKIMEHVPPTVKKGRTWNDFQDYINTHEVSDWVEMDTVIGCPGGKTIATFLFTQWNFMFGILLENKTALAMTEKITWFKKHLSDSNLKFGDIFPILLTDNGGEFANIDVFVNDLEGNKETELFFCEPYKSCEKPKVEKNHTLFRDICPKGTSFDSFTQEDVNFIFSHVNAVKRKKLDKKSPYEFFAFAYGEEVTSALGIHNIPPTEVIESPDLLKQLPSLK